VSGLPPTPSLRRHVAVRRASWHARAVGGRAHCGPDCNDTWLMSSAIKFPYMDFSRFGLWPLEEKKEWKRGEKGEEKRRAGGGIEREEIRGTDVKVAEPGACPVCLPRHPSRAGVITSSRTVCASLRDRRRVNWGATLSRNSQRRLGVPASARAGHRAAFRAFGRQPGTNIFSRGAVCFRRAGPESDNACKGNHPTDQPG